MTRPRPLSPELSTRMSARPRRDTGPEMSLRKALHALGLRFRLQRPVPGRPRRTIDITFPGARVAVFVDGCFWHGCPDHGITPRNNRAWWIDKLATNRARDQDTNASLIARGWRVVRVWEHTEASAAAQQIWAQVRCRDEVPGDPDG